MTGAGLAVKGVGAFPGDAQGRIRASLPKAKALRLTITSPGARSLTRRLRTR